MKFSGLASISNEEKTIVVEHQDKRHLSFAKKGRATKLLSGGGTKITFKLEEVRFNCTSMWGNFYP